MVGFVIPGRVGEVAYRMSDRKLRLFAAAAIPSGTLEGCRWLKFWEKGEAVSVPCDSEFHYHHGPYQPDREYTCAQCGMQSSLYGHDLNKCPKCPDCGGVYNKPGIVTEHEPPGRIIESAREWCRRLNTPEQQARLAALLREIVGNPFRPVELLETLTCVGCGRVNPRTKCEYTICLECNGDVVSRCLWLTPTVLSIATRCYDEADFSGLPVLADALEDAGCVDEAILDHLRNRRRIQTPKRKRYKDDAKFDVGQLVRVVKDLHPEMSDGKLLGTEWVVEEVEDLPTSHPTYNYQMVNGPYLHEEELALVEHASCDDLHVRGCWVLDLLLGKE